MSRSRVIDRRLNGKNKSAVNRDRFIRRFKEQIKSSVSRAISKRSIADIEKGGEKITIPAKGTREEQFSFGVGGKRIIILPGNDQFMPGDKIKRPPSSNSGQGSGDASQQGSGEDNFGFEISQDEFLELFFEDLALPNMMKKKLAKIKSMKNIRAGIATQGIPSNINVVRSMRQALGRRRALYGSYQQKIAKIKVELQELQKKITESTQDKEEIILSITDLEKKLSRLKKRSKCIPFIDTFDLRYNSKVQRPEFATSAVMLCLMDVSGSMDEVKKDIAKRFFILLYLFLKRTYKEIEIVFIRHHTSAKEVNEEEFFYSRETGGTVVSSALEMANNIIDSRYSNNDWNIYVAQASDGDNWHNDSPQCSEILANTLLNKLQHFSYVEIMPRHHQSLWTEYLQLQKQFPHFAMEHITDYGEIYPVFRKLFKQREVV